jgi:hypothetical protein
LGGDGSVHLELELWTQGPARMHHGFLSQVLVLSAPQAEAPADGRHHCQLLLFRKGSFKLSKHYGVMINACTGRCSCHLRWLGRWNTFFKHLSHLKSVLFLDVRKLDSGLRNLQHKLTFSMRNEIVFILKSSVSTGTWWPPPCIICTQSTAVGRTQLHSNSGLTVCCLQRPFFRGLVGGNFFQGLFWTSLLSSVNTDDTEECELRLLYWLLRRNGF